MVNLVAMRSQFGVWLTDCYQEGRRQSIWATSSFKAWNAPGLSRVKWKTSWNSIYNRKCRINSQVAAYKYCSRIGTDLEYSIYKSDPALTQAGVTNIIAWLQNHKICAPFQGQAKKPCKKRSLVEKLFLTFMFKVFLIPIDGSKHI